MDNPLIQLPLSLFCFKSRYIKQVINKWNDKNVVKALKKFCQNNNAYLLVKSRLKDPVRNYLSTIADKVLYDEEDYPATIIKCLSIADICINFFSSTVIEAASLGVPNICFSPLDWADIQIPFWKIMLKRVRQIFDFDGVSYMLNIPEVIKMLPEKSIKDFPLKINRQKEYAEKFIRGFPGKHSARALNEIEEMVNKN